MSYKEVKTQKWGAQEGEAKIGLSKKKTITKVITVLHGKMLKLRRCSGKRTKKRT